jgi:signal transduction histidine kinase
MNILHLEDSELDHFLVNQSLSNLGLDFSSTRVDSMTDFKTHIASTSYDIVIADYQLPGFTAADAWHAAGDAVSSVPFVLLSGAIGESAAVEAIKLGFNDYLAKDEMEKLGRVLQRAIQTHHQQTEKIAADRELAISQKRLAALTEHLQTAIEQERAAIARELHDDIGSALTAAKLDIAWIQRRNVNADVDRHAATALECVESAMDASKRIMLNLRPSILDEGLYAAIHWLTQSFTKRTSIPVQLRLDPSQASFPNIVSLAAFRTIQESLTNITRHAKCTAVKVDVSATKDVLTIEVTDNGIGLSSADLQKARSFGLRGLKERANHAGGWMDISSSPGSGTSITLSIPLLNIQYDPTHAHPI